MTPCRTIIVDGDSESRKQFAELLRPNSDFQLVDECQNGLEAIKLINTQKPNLVFLEIDMPDISGFEVVEHIELDSFPLIVFTSLVRDHAVEAFEVDAVDYIQKPITKERLTKSLNRVKKRISYGISEEEKENISEVIQNLKESDNLDRFIVKQHGEYHMIRAHEIMWIESDGNYSRLMTAEKKFMVRYTLTGFSEQLDDDKFYRISRSQIVNIDYVVKIKDYVYGNYVIELKDGTSLKMSKNYKHLLEVLKNF